MTDDVTTALHDLADSADLPPLSPPAVGAEAAARRRHRHLARGAAAAALLVSAPLAWSVVPEPAERVVEGTASERETAEPVGRLVSGTFELTYDGRLFSDASDDALTSCDALPGLLNSGFQLDSLPPIRSFHFAGTASQQGDAARCLEAMPAAIVTFEEDAFFVPVVLREAEAQAPGRLDVSASRLRPSADGWLEHDLIFINHGSEPLVVDPEALAEVMGGAIAASTGRCSALAVPDGGFACDYGKTARVLAPGESAVTTVELERDLPGMTGVQPGAYSLTWTQEVTDPEGQVLGQAVIALEYDVLTAAVAPSLDVVSRPPGETQVVQVFFSSAAGGDCQQVGAVPRAVPVTAAVATAALNELFAGPDPREQEQYGVRTAFSRETSDLLRTVRVEDGVAYVDLRPLDAVGLGNYSTSCGSVAFDAQVTRTLQQFSTVQEVRYAFDGDPRAFVEYMQGVCPDPVPADDLCDPEPFRR